VEGETIVGWSRARTRHEESGGSANVGVSVLPEHRRRGLGTALLRKALEHVAAAPRVFAFTPESGREFAEAHGFQLTSTSRLSAVDPRLVDTSELGRSEVEFRRLDEVGPEEVFAVDSVSMLDVPEEEPPDLIELDQWLLGTWQNPDFDWGSSFAAWVDGRAVAISYPAVDFPGRRAANAFTGTLPDYRGRGLARLVKLAVIRRLAALDVSLLLTVNHDVNAAMLAVNDRLGFAPYSSYYNYVRTLSGNGLRASAGST
jgi:GNAT superfamily N-acetyltransferase